MNTHILLETRFGSLYERRQFQQNKNDNFTSRNEKNCCHFDNKCVSLKVTDSRVVIWPKNNEDFVLKLCVIL